MRSHLTAVTLSLLLLAGACSKKESPTAGLSDDLTKDLAAAAATSSDLATAPKTYQRTRFVSDVERYKASAPIKRTAMTMHHSAQPTAAPEPVGEPAVESVPEPIAATVATTTAPAPAEAPVLDNAVGDAPPPYHGPASSPSGSGSEGVIIADRGGSGGGGLGGLFGGLGAVLRGGHVGVDKCDPRRDGRRRPTINGQPEVGDPLPVTPPSTFPGRGRGL